MTPASASLLERLAPGSPEAGTAAPARRWFEPHGLPTGKEEAWQYTPVKEIATRLAEAVPSAPTEVDASLVDELAGDLGGVRVVFVNGAAVPELSRHLPVAGVRIGADPTADPANDAAGADGAEGGSEPLRYDGYQALNRLTAAHTAVVVASAGVELTEPIHIVHVAVPGADATGSTAGITQPRTVVELGERSRLTVVESYVGIDGRSLTNASTTIALAEGAELTHHRVQAEAADAVHVGHTRIHQAAESQLRSISVMLGATIGRHALDLTMVGDHGHAELRGLYLPEGDQRHDNVVTVDHAGSHCTSAQQFRGVIADRGRGSFGGHVIVRSGTVGTDADQSNRNLLLSKTAQADARPWLEIFADDVRCTHGATVGRLDEEALFYLRSRGIALDDAETMLVSAFINEITDTVTPDPLRDHLTAAIARRGATP